MAAADTASLDVKLVLHVPHFSWQGRLVENQHAAFLRYLAAELASVGITSFYSVPAAGFYKGRFYAEELVTVFCAEDQKEQIIRIFENTSRTRNDLMQQEAFACECCGKLIVKSTAV